MAKNRMINTRFWADSWIVSLDPTEKLLFLYLLTNERTNLSGIYELPLRYIAVETGIDREMIERILTRFENDGKVQYIDGWIYLKNFQKYQNKKNPSIKLGIKREMSSLPASVLSRITNEKQSNEKGTTRIPLGNEKVHLTKPNLTKPNLTKERTPAQVSRDFFHSKELQKSILESFPADRKETVRAELEKFVNYWTELNKSGTKERWELQPTFEVDRRLRTWFGKAGQFQAKGQSKQVTPII